MGFLALVEYLGFLDILGLPAHLDSLDSLVSVVIQDLAVLLDILVSPASQDIAATQHQAFLDLAEYLVSVAFPASQDILDFRE